jgi:hypothetical protein
VSLGTHPVAIALVASALSLSAFGLVYHNTLEIEDSRRESKTRACAGANQRHAFALRGIEALAASTPPPAGQTEVQRAELIASFVEALAPDCRTLRP